MKHFKLLAFIAAGCFLASCSDDPKPGEKPGPGPGPGGGTNYEVTADMAFLSGDYYGDENKDGIARYTVEFSVDYQKKKATTRATGGSGEAQATDVLYLTFFSGVALDAEYALPEAGTYTVTPDKGISTLWSGQAKTNEEEYEGSYVVSTAGGTVQESKVTGGSVEVSYPDGKLTIAFNLEDEAGVFEKYDGMKLSFAGNGEESFVNHAIVYHIFNNPDGDYNRCYYWGPPMDEAKESEDGTELGDYMFEFSNAVWASPSEDGHVATAFSLMEEYQFYGLDRVIKPGVYPVNTESFRGRLGTIYVAEEKDMYSSSASFTIFEDGEATKYYVVDGWMAVFANEEGTPDRFVVNFVSEQGKQFHGRYEGELRITDEWTLSDLREDVTREDLTEAYMRIKKPDWRYEDAGVNHWELYIMEEGVSVSVNDYGYVTIHGPGECFRFEISTESSVTDALPAGTYQIEDSYEPGVAQQGNKDIGWIGIYSGAWFHRIFSTEDPVSSLGISGTLTIAKSGNNYTIEAIMYDDAKNTLKGKYVGIPIIEDHRPVPEPDNAAYKSAAREVGNSPRYSSKNSPSYRNNLSRRLDKAFDDYNIIYKL